MAKAGGGSVMVQDHSLRILLSCHLNPHYVDRFMTTTYPTSDAYFKKNNGPLLVDTDKKSLRMVLENLLNPFNGKIKAATKSYQYVPHKVMVMVMAIP